MHPALAQQERGDPAAEQDEAHGDDEHAAGDLQRAALLQQALPTRPTLAPSAANIALTPTTKAAVGSATSLRRGDPSPRPTPETKPRDVGAEHYSPSIAATVPASSGR